jgi:hemerythrin
MLKTWSDEYALGIQALDEQHRGFFEAGHRLYDAILNCEGEKRVEESVAFLRDYANRHFKEEEGFMEKHAYPHLAQHKKQHTEFLETLDGLRHDLELFGPSQHLADRTWEISQEWLVNHIIEEDTRYAHYIKQHNLGSE